MKEAKASAEIRQEDEIHALMVYRGCHAPSWKLTAWKLAAQLREAKEREERLNHAMALEPDVLRGWDKTLEERDALRAELGETKEALEKAEVGLSASRRDLDDMTRALERTKELVGACEIRMTALRADNEEMKRAVAEAFEPLRLAADVNTTDMTWYGTALARRSHAVRALKILEPLAARLVTNDNALDGREGGK